MLKRIREMKDEDGFTLIELMVVVLIIAILIAIAIPTFLGLRSRAQNRSAQSDLRNGLTAAKAFYTDADTYGDGAGPLTDFTSTEAAALEPALEWVGNQAPLEGEVAIRVAAGDDVLITTLSESGDYFGIGDTGASTLYCKGNVTTVATCTGTSPAAWA
jgi:type IV pilus assembly protein PilA